METKKTIERDIFDFTVVKSSSSNKLSKKKYFTFFLKLLMMSDENRNVHRSENLNKHL